MHHADVKGVVSADLVRLCELIPAQPPLGVSRI